MIDLLDLGHLGKSHGMRINRVSALVMIRGDPLIGTYPCFSAFCRMITLHE